jgi:enoyl-[acyl-carrier-protein] reductase (NADH)
VDPLQSFRLDGRVVLTGASSGLRVGFAGAPLFFVSDASSCVTGTTLTVDAGMAAL